MRHQWFKLICQTYDQLVESNRLGWDQFASSLAEAAGSAGVDGLLVEQFVQVLATDDLSPLETVGRMREFSSELPEMYQRLAETPGPEDSAQSYDESAWHAFLAEHGIRWDGQEASWEQFRTWFQYLAEQHGLAVPAQGFLAYVEEQADKSAVFTQYGVPIPAAGSSAEDHPAPIDVSTFPDVEHGDSGE